MSATKKWRARVWWKVRYMPENEAPASEQGASPTVGEAPSHLKTAPPQSRRTAAGVALVLISAAGYGTQAIFARLAYAAGVNVATLLLLRFTLSIALLWLVLLLRGRWRYAWVVLARPKRMLKLLALGMIFAGNSAAFFTALTYLHIAVVELLLYLYPGIVLMLSALFLRERLSGMKIVALLLALAGSALTVGPPGAVALPGIAGGRALLGLVIAASTGLIYACYIVWGARLTAGVPADVSGVVSMTGTTLVFVAGALAGDGASWQLSSEAWPAIGAVALFSTVIATSFFLAGLERLGPGRAAILATVEPVVTLILATLVLHDPPRWFQVVGGVLILLAVVLAQLAPNVGKRA
jgi:drug/metabolite transporter (DMT)-like permease